ncbi:MAG TPA: oligosaccharide flippase family protein [Lamprocystis sp. (in: g-proteobacteria)]|nr:oligosaccharide flippase family protein [Lamprocystis sp. (in: g-proteobacteria)]
MIKSTLTYAGSYILMRSVSFLTLPYVARVLGPVEFGRLDLLVTATMAVGLLAGFGIVEAVLRYASTEGQASGDGPVSARAAKANGLGLTLLCGLFFLLLLLALAPWLARVLPGDQESGLLSLAMLAGVASAWIALPNMVLRMQDRAAAYARFMIIYALLQAAGNVIAVYLGYGIFGIMVVSAGATCVMAAAAVIQQIRDSGIALDPRVARHLLIFGLPILGSGVAAFTMNGLERWVLAAHLNPESYGHYAAAVKLFMLSVIAFQPFTLWWGAQRYRLLAGPDGERRLVHYAVIGILLQFLLCTGISLLNPVLLPVLFGAAFEVPAWWASALLFILLLRSVADLMSIGLFLGHTSHQQMAIQYAAAAVTTLGVFTLIPWLGFPGLVLALTAGALLRLVLFYTVSQRNRPLHYPVPAIAMLFAGYLAASIGFATGLHGAGPQVLIPATGVVLALMVGLAWLTGRGALAGRAA